MQQPLHFELNFTELTTSEIVEKVVSPEVVTEDPFKLVVTTNVDHLVTMRKNKQFKRLCEAAWIVTADGFPVYKFLRLMGHDAKGRITGADLFPEIMAKITPEFHSPFFIVAQEETAKFLRHWLLEQHFCDANERVVVPDFGFEKDSEYTKQLLAKISLLKVSHLFFGVGAPKSELWMDTNREQLKGIIGFGFGAGIDFFSGNMKRAPIWMQNYGLEWLFRLYSEPRRLGRRYLINSWYFLVLAYLDYKKNTDLYREANYKNTKENADSILDEAKSKDSL